MQEGLFLLWLIFLAASAIAFAYVEIFLAREGRSSSRCQVTGCELARQVLDRNDQHRIAVINDSPASMTGRLASSPGQLFLADKIYFGTGVVSLARAVHAAGRHLVSSKSLLPAGLQPPAGRVFRTAAILSWCLILAGFFFRWGPIAWLGETLFILTCFLALASLPGEWEAAERAMANLVSLEMLGPEERVRIAQLLRAIRWSPLTEPLKTPLSVFRGRRTHPRKTHVVSKS